MQTLLLGAAGVVLASLVGIVGFAALERSRIVKEGVRVEATVLDLREEKVGHEKIRHVLKASVFTGDQQPGDGTLHKAFAASLARGGDLIPTTVSIPGERFATLKRGDRVTMAYPAGRPEQIILLDEDE